MSEKKRPASGQSGREENIPRETLPPEAYGQKSGKILLRDVFTKASPELIKNSTVGGIYLNRFNSWTKLDPIVKRLMEPAMLQFIARRPMPSDEEIEKEIEKQAPLAGKKTCVFRMLYDCKLPDHIILNIQAFAFETITQHPEFTEDDIKTLIFDLISHALQKTLEQNPEEPQKTGSGKHPNLRIVEEGEKIVKRISSKPPPSAVYSIISDEKDELDDTNPGLKA
jgi:hypothetical protein